MTEIAADVLADIVKQGEFTLSAEEAKNLAIHPYCLWFPALDGSDLEALGDSIQFQGLLEPIVLLNGEVFDGRHRLKACLDREVTPRFLNFEQLGHTGDPIDWVLAKNQHRRHLTSKQYLVIVTLSEAERLRRDGERRKQEGRRKGGRGHKKNLDLNSGPSLSAVEAKHANSTAGQIAAKAGTSRYEAEQALKILEQDPELMKRILAGNLSFDEAKRSANKPKRKKKPEAAWDLKRAQETSCAYLERALKKAPTAKQQGKLREHLIQWLIDGRSDA